MNQVKQQVVQVILDAIWDECERSPLATMLENHLKVVSLEALLRTGYSVLEGGTRTGVGKVLSLVDGSIMVKNAARPSMPALPGSKKKRNSPDIRVWEPEKVVVELQARSSYGTQDALFSANIADDVSRVLHGNADVFVLAADRPIYDSLRGVKKDRRGRKALHTDEFRYIFPESDSLEPGFRGFTLERPGLQISAAVTSAKVGIERVVIGMWSDSGSAFGGQSEV